MAGQEPGLLAGSGADVLAAAACSLSGLGKGREKGSGVKKKEEKTYTHPLLARCRPQRCGSVPPHPLQKEEGVPSPRPPSSTLAFKAFNVHLIPFKRKIDNDRVDKLRPRYSRAVVSSLRGACHIRSFPHRLPPPRKLNKSS